MTLTTDRPVFPVEATPQAPARIPYRVELTHEQQEARKHCVGASEAAAIVGMSPWETPWTVWRNKVGPERAYLSHRPGATEAEVAEFLANYRPRETTFAMMAGQYAEPAIIAWYEDETGARVVKPTVTQISDLYPHVGASLDGIHSTGDELVECKLVGPDSAQAHWVDEDGVLRPPPHVMIQVRQQMLVTGIRKANIAAWLFLHGGLTMQIFPVPYHAEEAERIAEAIENFWFFAVDGDEIPPDKNDAFKDWIKQVHPRDSGEILPANVEDWALFCHHHDIDAQIRELKRQDEQIDNEMRTRIGDASSVEGIDFAGVRGIASWKANKNGVRTLRWKGRKA